MLNVAVCVLILFLSVGCILFFLLPHLVCWWWLVVSYINSNLSPVSLALRPSARPPGLDARVSVGSVVDSYVI